MKIKNFFIQQPYAEMLVRGLRNALPNECFSKGDRIYINALIPNPNADTPLEWYQEVRNQQLFGNLPPDEDLTYSLCLGFVDVLRNANKRDSIWNETSVPSVIVHNAHAFDEPQLFMPRGSFSAQDIPTHKFTPSKPYLINDENELAIPVNHSIFKNTTKDSVVTFELAESLAIAATSVNGMLKNFSKFTLYCCQESKSFLWNNGCEIIWDQDPLTNDLVLYPSLDKPSGKAPRARLRLSCRHPFIF